MNLTTAPHRTVSSNTRQRAQRQRVLAVVAAVASTAILWSIVAVGFGQSIHGPVFGDGPPSKIGVGAVIAATAVSTLAGWGLLAALERRTSRPQLAWTAIAVGFALVSLGGPMSGSGVTSTDRAVLLAMHVLAAAVYISLMRRTFTTRRDAP